MTESRAPTQIDRRPIRTRERSWARRISAALANTGVSPNAISVFGMLCAIGAGVALASTRGASGLDRIAWVAGAVLIQCRLLANMFDGMVAISQDRASPVGELFNELPDRVSDAAVLVGFGYAAGAGTPVLGYVAALVASFVTHTRSTVAIAGGGQDYSGPMAKQHRMFVITAACIAMAALPEAWQPVWHASPDLALGIPAFILALTIVGGLWTAYARLRRGVRRLRGDTHG